MYDELPNTVSALLQETFRIRALRAIDASTHEPDDITREMAADLLCDGIGPVAIEAALSHILEEFDAILTGSITRTVEVAGLEQKLGPE